MNKTNKTFAAIVVGLLCTTSMALAADNSGATGTIQKLIGANLQEAALLTSQLPSLRGHSDLAQDWRTMIREHKQTAQRLAQMDRRLGATPDLTMPHVTSKPAPARKIFDNVFQAHVDTLQTVKGIGAGASDNSVKQAAHIVSDTVRHHLALLGADMLRHRWWFAGQPTRMMAGSGRMGNHMNGRMGSHMNGRMGAGRMNGRM